MRALLSILVALLAACGGAVEERILGEWVFDADAQKKLDSFRNMPESERRGALDSLEIRAPRFRFTRDELTFRLSGGGQVLERTTDYRFVSRDGERFVLEATGEAGRTQRMECEFDGDTLVIAMEGQAVAYERAKR